MIVKELRDKLLEIDGDLEVVLEHPQSFYPFPIKTVSIEYYTEHGELVASQVLIECEVGK